MCKLFFLFEIQFVVLWLVLRMAVAVWSPIRYSWIIMLDSPKKRKRIIIFLLIRKSYYFLRALFSNWLKETELSLWHEHYTSRVLLFPENQGSWLQSNKIQNNLRFMREINFFGIFYNGEGKLLYFLTHRLQTQS